MQPVTFALGSKPFLASEYKYIPSANPSKEAQIKDLISYRASFMPWMSQVFSLVQLIIELGLHSTAATVSSESASKKEP